MQLRSNPDFMQGDFEMFSRVWGSIESLCLTSGLRKIMQERLAYEVYLNIKLVWIFSYGDHLGEVEIEKSTISLKYARDAKRIFCSRLLAWFTNENAHLSYHYLNSNVHAWSHKEKSGFFVFIKYDKYLVSVTACSIFIFAIHAWFEFFAARLYPYQWTQPRYTTKKLTRDVL